MTPQQEKSLAERIVEAELQISIGNVRRFTLESFHAYTRFVVRSDRDYVRKKNLFRRMENRYKRLTRLARVRFDQLSDALEDWEDKQMRIALDNDPELQELLAQL